MCWSQGASTGQHKKILVSGTIGAFRLRSDEPTVDAPTENIVSSLHRASLTMAVQHRRYLWLRSLTPHRRPRKANNNAAPNNPPSLPPTQTPALTRQSSRMVPFPCHGLSSRLEHPGRGGLDLLQRTQGVDGELQPHVRRRDDDDGVVLGARSYRLREESAGAGGGQNGDGASGARHAT